MKIPSAEDTTLGTASILLIQIEHSEMLRICFVVVVVVEMHGEMSFNSLLLLNWGLQKIPESLNLSKIQVQNLFQARIVLLLRGRSGRKKNLCLSDPDENLRLPSDVF